MPSAMAVSTKADVNANNAINKQNSAGGAATLAQSQRLDAIRNMMASSGQGGIQGTISADLQQALADGDASLDSIQLRLQTLSSEGATHFDKAKYFADRSPSERLVATPVVPGGGFALARANQAVDSSPDVTAPRADAAAAARLATESTRFTSANASSGTSAGADQLAGDQVDPRRAAMAFASAQNKQIAGRADAMTPDNTARTANLADDDLQQALSAPRATESQIAAREAQVAAREAGSTGVDGNADVSP